VLGARYQLTVFGERFFEVLREKDRLGLGIVDDKGELFRMQPEVEGHGSAAQLEAGIQCF
jgi:hypothetical protein